jgi:hypothetical protein
MRVDQITGDRAEQLKFPGSAANANCALRTLRRMLYKAEEWKMIGHAPKIRMMKSMDDIFGLTMKQKRNFSRELWPASGGSERVSFFVTSSS